MIRSYKRCWKHYLNFGGRASRSDYWWVLLINVLLIVMLTLLAVLFGETLSKLEKTNPILMMLITIFFVALFFFGIKLPTISLSVRRLRDSGFHWLFILLPIVPFGGIILLILLAQPSKTTPQTAAVEEESELFL